MARRAQSVTAPLFGTTNRGGLSRFGVIATRRPVPNPISSLARILQANKVAPMRGSRCWYARSESFKEFPAVPD